MGQNKGFLFGDIPTTSQSGSFDVNDFKKVLRHLLMVGAGMVLTGILDYVGKWLTGADFGQWQWAVGIVVSSGGLEAARSWIASHLQ